MHTKKYRIRNQGCEYIGTGGTKEGLSSIARFRKQQQMLFILAHFYAMWK